MQNFFPSTDAVHMERTSATVYMCFFICVSIFITDFCSGHVLKVPSYSEMEYFLWPFLLQLGENEILNN